MDESSVGYHFFLKYALQNYRCVLYVGKLFKQHFLFVN